MNYKLPAIGAIVASAKLAPWALLLILVLRGIIIAIYRLYFHPLAKFPGPWLARMTDLYPAWYNALGRLHVETERGHREYGPIYRQAPNKLVTNNGTALQEIYHSKSVQKGVGYTTMVPAPGAFNVFTSVDKDIHRFKRRVLDHGFSHQRIREFEPRILEHVNIFLKRLLPSHDTEGIKVARWSSRFNMTECCRHLGYDIMGEFGFGQSFKLQETDENAFLIDAVTATVNKAGLYVLYPELQRLHLELLFYARGMKMREKYLSLMSRLVRSRVAAGKDARRDLFSFLVDARDPETDKGFTEDELWAESRFLLIAGADTTSTAMTAIFFYLAAYPECYEKLTMETRSTFRSLEEIRSGPELSSCQYLRACIDEAMRMSPPISSSLWREVIVDDFSVDGTHIPKGVDIAVSPYAFHHNEELFADSYTFRPERWIESPHNSRAKIEPIRQMFSVFSVGSRACAGKTLAYTELSDTIARTAWLLDMQSADESMEGLGGGQFGACHGRNREREFQLHDHLTCSHDGPSLRFRVRDGVEVAALQLMQS